MARKEETFLKGSRFTFTANDHFIMLSEDFESADFTSKKWIGTLKRYISRHKSNQVGRLEELKRYYLADNNIKYREKKTDTTSADNRIASDWGRFITTFEQGYMLGNPITYKNDVGDLQALLDEFNKVNNEHSHNVAIKTDLAIYGRAYELLQVIEVEDVATPRLYKLPALQTFVVYDDTHEHRSLFGVNYYTVDYEEGHKREIIKVYTADQVHSYEADNLKASGMVYKGSEDHYFKGVPVNEYANNEERTGAFESVLDNIDAYDLSQSELANFQQDSLAALLVISGNPYTGSEEADYLEDGQLNPNGPLAVTQGYKRAQVLILDDNPNPGGATPSASYLVKQYDSAGAEAYKQRLVQDILRFTFTPDTTDSHFAGSQSGEAIKYKLMASDNYRERQQLLFEKGLMRRLRLVVNIWAIKGNDALNYQAINQTSIIFTPNLPQNEGEVVAMAKQLYGLVSDQTILEMLKEVTGIDAEKELARLKEETEEETETVPLPRVEVVNDQDQETEEE